MDGAGQVRPAGSRHAVGDAVHLRPRARPSRRGVDARDHPERGARRLRPALPRRLDRGVPGGDRGRRWDCSRACSRASSTTSWWRSRSCGPVRFRVARCIRSSGGSWGRSRSPTCTRSSRSRSSARSACRSSRSSSCRSRWRSAAARATTPTCCAGRWAASAASRSIDSLREKLYEGMKSNGIVGADADSIYAKIQAFAGFGFAESHALSFGLLVYASAWLRLHYPAAFLASLLRAQPMGFYSPQSLISDARRHGVEVLRPDIQRSLAAATLEPLPVPEALEGTDHARTSLRSLREPQGPPQRPAVRHASTSSSRPLASSTRACRSSRPTTPGMARSPCASDSTRSAASAPPSPRGSSPSGIAADPFAT